MRWKRIGSITFSAVLGLAVWQAGPALRATPQLAFAQEIEPVEGYGNYAVTYFDVSSSFKPSQQGYGGPGHSGGNGDALLHIVDVGNFEADPTGGDLCANIYVFDDDQEMQECCSCKLTADSVQTFSTINDLTANPQFSSPLGVGVIKIVTTNIGFGCINGTATGGTLGTAGSIQPMWLAEGLTSWINHAESIASNNPGFTPPFGFVTSTSVSHVERALLDSGELTSTNHGLVPACANIELHASGRGICHCGIGS